MTAPVLLAALALVSGTPHADRLATDDGKAERVVCLGGADLVTADKLDRVAGDCETVVRRIAADPLRGGRATHATIVEPDSAAAGSTVVSTFQVGRNPGEEGGAAAIVFATSHDAGRSWRSGLLPGVRGGDPPNFVSDPSVGFDAANGTWLAATLFGTVGVGTGVEVSRSADGVTWSAPLPAATSAAHDLAFDKEWITCDGSLRSSFRGRCYIAYTAVLSNSLAVIHSDDGGVTWSAPSTVPPTSNEELSGAQPAVLPDGTLDCLYVEGLRVRSAVSHDGGATFPTAVDLVTADATRVRFRPGLVLPSAEVGGDGRVHVVWAAAGGAVVASSGDGVTWSAPAAVPAVPSGRVAFIPALGADPAGPRLAVTAYGLDGDTVDAYTTISRDGTTWGAPRRLSARTVPAPSLVFAPQPFLGDYTSTEFAGGRVVPVFTLAAPPAGSTLQEGLYSTTLAP